MRDHDGFHGTILSPIVATLIILGLAFLLACTSGCSALTPGKYGQNTLEVHNSSTHDITVSVNGRLMEFKFDNGHKSRIVPPGESVRLKYSRTMAVLVKFYDHGRYVGWTSDKKRPGYGFYIGDSDRDADVWGVGDSDIRRGGSIE